ncbi:hypothetical protein EVAR_44384_1 [Eumeta japonica]|uniref:Uncharacterized protein n=1 Tax=Eumeta variegata TaxID=151549 RepID=A0A4C1X9V9_EUMVA|nr:hypothetical protein EVAR_44384_1 [Eumeta japonica]
MVEAVRRRRHLSAVAADLVPITRPLAPGAQYAAIKRMSTRRSRGRSICICLELDRRMRRFVSHLRLRPRPACQWRRRAAGRRPVPRPRRRRRHHLPATRRGDRPRQ